jgi:hypothetical protein
MLYASGTHAVFFVRCSYRSPVRTIANSIQCVNIGVITLLA